MAWFNNAVCCVVVFALLMFSGTVIPYIVGASRNDTQWFVPFISDGGLRGPERYIFSETLNTAAFVGMILILVKFQVIRSVTGGANVHINRLSKTCLIIGSISTFSLTFVANFPEEQLHGVGDVHLSGAALIFGLGTLYAILDSTITVLISRMTGQMSMKWFEWVRPVLALCSLVSFVLTYVGTQVSSKELNKRTGNMTLLVPHWWKYTEAGYEMHVLATLSEWLTALFFVLYFLTFSCDFKQFNIHLELHDRQHHIEVEYHHCEQEADTAAAAEQSHPASSSLLQNPS